MFREGQAVITRREDYQAPGFWIDNVDLVFDLDPLKTRVLNTMLVRRNPDVAALPLRLDGEDLNLSRVLVNGQGTSFKMDGEQLVLENLPEGDEPFKLEIFTTCNPSKNTQLSGLYISQDSFFTQCEAQGFRHISYFLDRPDVMSVYSVTLRADKRDYPVLLSNGNLVAQGELEDGRHFAKWFDPHHKPSYLFALVAGKLVCREQRITARNGKEHLLQIYVRSGDLDKTDHAMQSLMASIAWDEARFGLGLDLERFMVVATSDFNMGAMENKGLNIFNTKYVLASPSTATDQDYANIESVVGHEYFHNWTGNRITCRDWFQLSLKEGLTVFRDQEFSQDLCGSASARAVKRIEDVRLLRTVQFAEDAGPMAHPVRPDSYMEINNFYTVTIYEKGAEVVRMMQTLVGREGFAMGMKLYFQRHDGQAVTCDEFVQAIADANPATALYKHLEVFKRWYSQAGTPKVTVQMSHDLATQTLTLHFTQTCQATPGQSHKQAFLIPIHFGLLNETGESVLNDQLFVLHESQQTLVLENMATPVIPSLLRGFSAPVQLEFAHSESQWLVLLAHDTDAFNRWEASQRLYLAATMQALAQEAVAPALLSQALISGLRQVLRHPELDAAFKELVLTLPSESYIAEQASVVDPQKIHQVREAMRLQIALEMQEDWKWAYDHHRVTGEYSPDATSSGRRALQGLALNYLCLAGQSLNDDHWAQQAVQAFNRANNMTERMHALQALVAVNHPMAEQALATFHHQFKHEELVLDKWFAVQASACDHHGHVLGRVRQLMQHPDFQIRNPNRARSLVSSYCSNPAAFHRTDAAGYVFWSERVLELDSFNPQVAARLARALDRWRKLSEPYRSAAHEAIRRVAAKEDLSADVREVIDSALEE
ncbi:MAG: aminopeptidase N [Limnohabitans sp.]